MKNVKTFSEFSLNESVISDLFNLVRRAFGDQKSVLDSLASSYEEEEMEYASEWNKIVSDIDELQLKDSEPDLTPGQKRAYARQISNKEKLLKALDNKKDKEIDFLNKKAEKAIGGDPKIASYWNVKKAKIEAKIAKKLLDLSRRLASNTYAQTLKSRYENAAREAINSERTFKNYFAGDSADKKEKTVKEEEVKIKELLDMKLSDFPEAVRKMSKTYLREVIRELKRARNEALASSDLEREKMSQKAQKMTDSEKRKEFQEKETKEINRKYRDQISDLRSKITIAQRYD
jgi:hypothetical protein